MAGSVRGEGKQSCSYRYEENEYIEIIWDRERMLMPMDFRIFSQASHDGKHSAYLCLAQKKGYLKRNQSRRGVNLGGINLSDTEAR